MLYIEGGRMTSDEELDREFWIWWDSLTELEKVMVIGI